jgi:site-specific recombinase XerD
MHQPLPQPFQDQLDGFFRSMAGKNRSPKTILAYSTDLGQFLAWVVDNDYTVESVADIQRSHIIDFLAALSERKLTGVSRARKLAALREFFRYLIVAEVIAKSPTSGIDTPKIEHNGKAWLRPDEYSRMLTLSAGNPRDYCILMVFLQTGIRVSELCNLRLDDIDLKAKQLTVRSGKGMQSRQIALETKGLKALRTWLKLRPMVEHDHVFTNERDGGAITERGVRMLVTKYREGAGITKQASCHALRHTFATVKASKGVSPYHLQRLLGHAKLDTTMVYVHLGRENEAAVMEETSL